MGHGRRLANLLHSDYMSVFNMPHSGEAESNSWRDGDEAIAWDKRVFVSFASDILLQGVSFRLLAFSAGLIEFIRGEIVQDFDTRKQRYSPSDL